MRRDLLAATTADVDAQQTAWPALLSATLVAKYTSLGKSTIWQLLAKEEFPAPIKVGARTLWKRADVDAWIEDQVAVTK